MTECPCYLLVRNVPQGRRGSAEEGLWQPWDGCVAHTTRPPILGHTVLKGLRPCKGAWPG